MIIFLHFDCSCSLLILLSFRYIYHALFFFWPHGRCLEHPRMQSTCLLKWQTWPLLAGAGFASRWVRALLRESRAVIGSLKTLVRRILWSSRFDGRDWFGWICCCRWHLKLNVCVNGRIMRSHVDNLGRIHSCCAIFERIHLGCLSFVNGGFDLSSDCCIDLGNCSIATCISQGGWSLAAYKRVPQLLADVRGRARSWASPLIMQRRYWTTFAN